MISTVDSIFQQLTVFYGPRNTRIQKKVLVAKTANFIIKFLIDSNPTEQCKFFVLKSIYYPQNKENASEELTKAFNNDNIFNLYIGGVYAISEVYTSETIEENISTKYLCYKVFSLNSETQRRTLYDEKKSLDKKEIFKCCHEPLIRCDVIPINQFSINLSEARKLITEEMFQKYMILFQVLPTPDVYLTIWHFLYQLGYVH